MLSGFWQFRGWEWWVGGLENPLRAIAYKEILRWDH